MVDSIQDLGYCSGAEEKKPSRVRFTPQQTLGQPDHDPRLTRVPACASQRYARSLNSEAAKHAVLTRPAPAAGAAHSSPSIGLSQANNSMGYG